MQLFHVMLAMLVVLLAASADFTSASKCGVKTATPPAAIDNIPTTIPISTTQEERSKGATGAAVRTTGGISANPPTGQNPDMVTNTTYDGNGVWQRVHKWWKRTFTNDASPTRRLRQQTSSRSSK